MGDVRAVLLIEQAQRLGKLWGWLRWAIAPLVVTAVGASVLLQRCHADSCAEIVRRGAGQSSLDACESEYAETGNPIALRGYVQSLIALRDFERARAFASALISTSEQPAGWRQLGECSSETQDPERSTVELELSLAASKLVGDREAAVRALDSLQRTYLRRGRFATAFRISEQCIADAKAAKLYDLELNCHVAAAGAAIGTGALVLAKHQLDAADELLPRVKDSLHARATIAYEAGQLEQDTISGWPTPPHDSIAVTKFHEFLELNLEDQQPDFSRLVYQNLVPSLARLHRISEARVSLLCARLLTAADDLNSQTQNDVQQAYIEFQDGNLEYAYQLNSELFARLDVEDKLTVAEDQARIALNRHLPVEAERWARTAIDLAEHARRDEDEPGFPSLGISSHRVHYDLLFRSLVAQKRDADALLTLLAWQARSVPSVVAAADAPQTLRQAARQADAFQAWLPAPQAFSREDALRALAQIDLVVVTVIDNQVWVITNMRGVVQCHEIGDYSDVSDTISQLAVNQAAPARALAAGQRMLPSEVYRQTSQALYVIQDGRLASLSVPALRRSDGLLTGFGMSAPALVELRPVVRLLRLPMATCRPVPYPRRILALANAQGDLPESEREIAAVRETQVATTSFTRASATRDALVSVQPGDALLIATHAGISEVGGEIFLAEQSVSAMEISTWKLDVPVAVLSACATGQSKIDDIDLHASLAGALLLAGTRRVVATQRPVSDHAAAEFSKRFYAHDGLGDPVAATRAAQLELIRDANTEWPLFSVFVDDICSIH